MMETPVTIPPVVSATKPVLVVHGLTKSFGGKTVVEDVSFDLRPGEVLALVGENGAGKSTLKNMLCGLLKPSSGEMLVEGETIHSHAGSESGVSAVHQELSLFGSLTVAENMCITNLPGSAGRIDWAEAKKVAHRQLEFLGIDINVMSTVESLGAGKQQIVEIGKALLTADRVLILDEPTTSLTAVEREKLFAIIDTLRKRGLAIIFISHFMEEIYRVCQSYIVLRDGQQVGSGNLADMPQRRLEELMVGRTFEDARIDLGTPQEDITLKVDRLNSVDFADVSFSAHRGEILGISGLMGAGRTELAEAIFGLRPATGEVSVNGVPVHPLTVDAMKARSVCYVPEDRRTNGLFLNRPVRENLSAAGLLHFVTRSIRGFGFKGERDKANGIVADMNISVPHLESDVSNLSGGNQQKALLGRWLSVMPDILIFDEPTKGVDIGAKFDIHATIAELARSGRTVVIVSSDLPELLNLTHRMIVMRKGRIAGVLSRDNYDSVKVISLAASESVGEIAHA